MRHLLSILILGLLMTPGLRADEARIALVIGNQTYEHTAELQNPFKDSSAMAEKLEKLGFHVISGQNLNRRATLELLQRFSKEARGADVALFYFAGHGVQVASRNYLLPTDARLAAETDLKYEAFDLDGVLEYMAPARKLRLAILDACRDNPLARTMSDTTGTRSAAVGRGLARIEAPPGDTLIAYATEADSTADDGVGRTHSPYTEALLAHIETPGRDVLRMFGDVRDAVRTATRNAQNPTIYTSIGGETWSFAPAAHTPGALAYWGHIKLSEDPEVFREFIERFEDPILVPLARARLDLLEAGAGGSATPNPGVPAASSQAAGVRTTAESLARIPEIPRHYIQIALADLGLYTGIIDGLIGPRSREAIRRWEALPGKAEQPDAQLSAPEILELFTTAAAAGHPRSQNILGMMYATGIGLARDAEEARKWFERSNAQGDGHAAYNLGLLYRDGLGVTASPDQARLYFQRAATLKHPEASKALKALN